MRQREKKEEEEEARAKMTDFLLYIFSLQTKV